jgi:hypothetical protein
MYNMQVSGIKKLMKLAKKKANHTVLHLLRPLRQRRRPSRALHQLRPARPLSVMLPCMVVPLLMSSGREVSLFRCSVVCKHISNVC